MTMIFNKAVHMLVVAASCVVLGGCVGTVVGAVVDTTIEVVKIPFKVGGAVIDAVTPDDLSDQNNAELEKVAADDAALESESEGL